jgi:hypothetical protein
MAMEFGIAPQVLVCRDSTFCNIPSQYKPYESALPPLIHILCQSSYNTCNLAYHSCSLRERRALYGHGIWHSSASIGV